MSGVTSSASSGFDMLMADASVAVLWDTFSHPHYSLSLTLMLYGGDYEDDN